MQIGTRSGLTAVSFLILLLLGTRIVYQVVPINPYNDTLSPTITCTDTEAFRRLCEEALRTQTTTTDAVNADSVAYI